MDRYHYVGIDVGTPFDYSTQSALYIPENMPSPKKREEWRVQAH
jgi:hypothetical protein